jgi:hypothetical protein
MPATTSGRGRHGSGTETTVRYTELAPDEFKNFWRD